MAEVSIEQERDTEDPEKKAEALSAGDLITSFLHEFDDPRVDKQITRIIRTEVAQRGGEIPDIEEVIFNMHYWRQRLLKNPEVKLRWDDPLQIIYPQQGWTTMHRPSWSPVSLPVPTAAALRYYTKNFNEVLDQFRQRRREIERVLADRSLLIVTNHASWVNVPMIMFALSKALNIPKENIYSVLGPALTVYIEGFLTALSFGNLVKTVPDTKNGNIPGAEELIGIIRMAFLRQTRKILNKPGNIAILAPTGTRDKLDEEGEIGVKDPSKTSRRLIKAFGADVLVVGTNDIDIYTPEEKMQRGSEHLSIGRLFPNSEIDKNGQNVLKELAKHIVDENRQQIGVLLDEPA